MAGILRAEWREGVDGCKKGTGFQRRYLYSGRIRGGITQLPGDATAVSGCWTWVKRALILPILVDVFDPWADVNELRRQYDLELRDSEDLQVGQLYGAVIAAVAHDEFRTINLTPVMTENSITYDAKGVLKSESRCL